MPERWEHELRNLRRVAAPNDLRGRALEGPSGDPGRSPRERLVAATVALAVFVGAGALALRTFGAAQPGADRTPGANATAAIVIEFVSGNPPSATMRYGDQALEGVVGGYTWCDGDACVSGTADFAFYPPVSEYLVAPPGTPIEFTGDGAAERRVMTDRTGDATLRRSDEVPHTDGVYALQVDATWDRGSAELFFGIQALSSPSAAPEVLGVDCSAGIARVDTAVVQTQADGLHLSFTGGEGFAAFQIARPEGTPVNQDVSIGGALPVSGDRGWAIPPGRWQVGCGRSVDDALERAAAPFELIDPDDHAAPDLTCDGASQQEFRSSIASSTPLPEAAEQLVTRLVPGDRVREGGYGADTFKLGPTFVVDRSGEAVAQMTLWPGEDQFAPPGELYTSLVRICPDSGIEIAPGATDDLAPIEVTTPTPGQTISSPVRIAGTADVFEANVRVRIVDQVNNVIADTFTTASCGTGCRGDFAVEVPFAVAEEQQGEIIVFEESAEGGRPINQVRIPITLVPGENVAEARAFLGPWTDAQGEPLPQDVLTVTLGAEHCSWGDIVFLRLASNARSTENAPTFVRDTTGELAEVSLGTWAVRDELPEDAASTGFRTGEWELWISPADPDAVLLSNRDTGRIERWPALRSPVGCD